MNLSQPFRRALAVAFLLAVLPASMAFASSDPLPRFDLGAAVTLPSTGQTTCSVTQGCYSLQSSIKTNQDGTTTYTWTVTSNCGNGLSHIVFPVNDLNEVVSPSTGPYTSGNGNTYNVVYQSNTNNNNPVKGIKFETQSADGIKSGQSDVFTYTLKSGAQPPSPYYVYAKAGNANGNSTELIEVKASDCSSAPAPKQIDLELQKSASAQTVQVGQNVDFTLSLVNKGPDAATGVEVADVLPAGLDYVSSSSSDVSYDASSRTLTWSAGSLAKNGTASATFTATVTKQGQIVNEAEVSSANEGDVDSTPGNDKPAEDDQDDATVTGTPVPTGPQIDLSLTKTVDQPAPQVGDHVTFTITITNDGPDAASGVEVRDDLRAELDYVSSTSSVGSISQGGGVVTWTVGALAKDASETLTVTAQVNTAGTHENVAQVSAANEDDVDSTPNNSVPSEDDQDDASVTTTGTTGGGDAGVESNGSMALAMAQRLYQRREDVAAQAVLRLAPEPVAFSAYSGKSGSILRDLMPVNGPGNTAAFDTSPTDLLSLTNATEVVAADYLRPSGQRVGAAFAAVSPGDRLYDHTKNTCDRFGGGRLDHVRELVIGGRVFVLSKLVQPTGEIDYAVSFAAYRSGTSFVVESRFASNQYVVEPGADEVLNFQVWSVSPGYTQQLVRDVMSRLEAMGTVSYRDARGTGALPHAYVVNGAYLDGQLTINVRNTTRQAVTLPVRGEVALTETDAARGIRQEFERMVTIPAATADAPETTVTLDVGSFFDGSFKLDDQASMDQFYVADGTWSHYAGGSDVVTSFETLPETREASENAYVVERAVSLQGQVKDYVSTFRYLRPSGDPVDLTSYSSLDFSYSSTTPVQVLIEKASVQSWADKFVVELPANASGTTVSIPLSTFAPIGGALGTLDADDVTMIAFYALGSGSSAPFRMEVGQVAFAGGQFVSAESGLGLGDTSLLGAAPNPVRGEGQLRFQLAKASPVRVSIYDTMGRELVTVLEGTMPAGAHAAPFSTNGLASGVYIYRLVTPSGAKSQAFTVAR